MFGAMIRVLFLIGCLAAGPARSQVTYRVDGPSRLPLGEPLVLDVYATRLDAGAWPRVAVQGMTNEEAFLVRRDSSTGPVVDLQPHEIVCGISAPWVLTGDEAPAGATAHARLVAYDARLSEPGRYVVEVRLDSVDAEMLIWTRIVPYTVEVVAPRDPAGLAAAEAVARSIREATDARSMGWGEDPLPVWRERLERFDGAPVADHLLAVAGEEAYRRWWNVAAASRRPNPLEADSVASAYRAEARTLLGRYLRARPAGALAERAARALSALSSDPSAPVQVPAVQGGCEGRVFRVFHQGDSAPLDLVAMGTGERVRIDTDAGPWVEVRLEAVPEAVHLVREAAVIGVAFPSRATCGHPLWRPPAPPPPVE